MESVVRKIRNFIVKIKIQEFELEEIRRGVGDTLVCVTSSNPLPRHLAKYRAYAKKKNMNFLLSYNAVDRKIVFNLI